MYEKEFEMTALIIDPTIDDAPSPSPTPGRLGSLAFGLIWLGALAVLIWSVVAPTVTPVLLTAIG